MKEEKKVYILLIGYNDEFIDEPLCIRPVKSHPFSFAVYLMSLINLVPCVLAVWYR